MFKKSNTNAVSVDKSIARNTQRKHPIDVHTHICAYGKLRVKTLTCGCLISFQLHQSWRRSCAACRWRTRWPSSSPRRRSPITQPSRHRHPQQSCHPQQSSHPQQVCHHLLVKGTFRCSSPRISFKFLLFVKIYQI